MNIRKSISIEFPSTENWDYSPEWDERANNRSTLKFAFGASKKVSSKKWYENASGGTITELNDFVNRSRKPVQGVPVMWTLTV